MPNYYIYLASSLPMLHFGNPPPFSFSVFIQQCQGLVCAEDIRLLSICAEDKNYAQRVAQPTMKKWYAFEISLRNELVKIRAGRRHADTHKDIRGDTYPELSVIRIAMNAAKNPSPIETERMLDEERWNFLEGLKMGHFFDIDFLIVYAQQLLILEKWEKIKKADKPRLLEEALSGPPN